MITMMMMTMIMWLRIVGMQGVGESNDGGAGTNMSSNTLGMFTKNAILPYDIAV